MTSTGRARPLTLMALGGAKTLLAALVALLIAAPAWGQAPQPSAVLKTYADIAQASYEDALSAAAALQKAVAALVAKPSEETLKAARTAWKAARVPYMQTEAFRFGNPEVDEWEGKVNAWPLDEGLIDYVDASYGSSNPDNPLFTANVVANRKLTVGGKLVDTSRITKALLADSLHEAGGAEANVATGYHAIEFLLWGQDLNGTGPGAGVRPASDFDTKACTHGNCDRRAAYLRTATALLVDDLKEMAVMWGPKGKIRARLTTNKPEVGLAAIVKGLGSLSYGELAGERMKLGVMLHDPEEEHDCFSDNTHHSHYYDQVGIMNVYLGRYTRTNGKKVGGPSLADLVTAKNAALGKEVSAKMDGSLGKLKAIVTSAEGGKAYDQLLAEGDAAGNKLVMAAVDALVEQAKALERVIPALGLGDVKFEGSDSLDDPAKVKK